MEKILLVQMSACLAETITYPIDYIKTLLQINNKKTIKPIILQVYSNHSQIYNGLKPSLIRHSIYTTSRINIYELMRNTTQKYTNKETTFVQTCVLAGFSGGISQLLASPFDLLKIQYITNPALNQNSMYQNINKIYIENGIRGLYRGVVPNVSRAMLVNVGEIATYDLSKRKIKELTGIKESTKLHIMSSIMSGFCSSLLCTPADVLKSRMMQYNSNYVNMFDCCSQTIRKEGFISLYRGFFPIWFRLAPWQLTFWVSYEKSRQIFNIDTF